MSLQEARKLLIKKLHARILEIENNRAENPDKNSIDEITRRKLFSHYFNLKTKEELEETPLWKSEFERNFNQPNNFNILVTPQAYKIIRNDSENSKIKEVIEKAISFSISGSFFSCNEPEPSLTYPDSVGCSFSIFRSPISVEAMWEKGSSDKRIIVIRNYPVDPCVSFFLPHKWSSLFRRCLPLSVA